MRATTRREEILRSTARMTRLIFDAHAASVFIYDSTSEALVLEPTSEESADVLIGLTIPAFKGIAGWVFQSGEPTSVCSVADDPHFDLELARSTGYVPSAIMAAPLTSGHETYGVL